MAEYTTIPDGLKGYRVEVSSPHASLPVRAWICHRT